MKCGQSQRKIGFNSITLEKVLLDSVHTSFCGFSGIYQGRQLFFYDGYFVFLYLFDGDGAFEQRLLGLGRGPAEVLIPGAKDGAVDSNGDLCILGSTMDFETFDAGKQQTNYIQFAYQPDKEANPENFFNYSYSDPNIQARYRDGKFYVNLFSERPDYNHFDNQADFINSSYRVGVVDPGKKTTRMIVRGFPPIYHENVPKYAAFDLVNPEFSGDDLLINFEADSTIYRCSIDGNPKSAFGVAGRGMDQDYLNTKGFNEQTIKNYMVNRSTKGYYHKMTAVGNKLFRSYIRGVAAENDGLQIYDKDVLIGDVDVPKGFSVAGEINGMFYSEIIADADSGEMYCYRFRL